MTGRLWWREELGPDVGERGEGRREEREMGEDVGRASGESKREEGTRRRGRKGEGTWGDLHGNMRKKAGVTDAIAINGMIA